MHAGGYLVVGAFAAATLQLVIPRTALNSIANNEVLSILLLAGLAVLLSICSEADAFVAAGLPQFSLTSRLVFLVVGPVIDIKLVAMHAGVFGRRFAMIFAPVTLTVAVVVAVVDVAVVVAQEIMRMQIKILKKRQQLNLLRSKRLILKLRVLM